MNVWTILHGNPAGNCWDISKPQMWISQLEERLEDHQSQDDSSSGDQEYLCHTNPIESLLKYFNLEHYV